MTNAVTGDYLNNARIAIAGSNRFAFTDESGAYRLTGVPVGPVTLRVFFTGLDEVETVVPVVAGQATAQDFGLSSQSRYDRDVAAVKLDAFRRLDPGDERRRHRRQRTAVRAQHHERSLDRRVWRDSRQQSG